MSPIQLCTPTKADGFSVYQLIESCPPLDTNSSYCNLLQCTHFSNTSVLAKNGTETLGFVSGYLQPEAPETLFVWQVAVSNSARGQGLAKRMLKHLLERSACKQVKQMETTITSDNDSSWALFKSLAKDLNAPLASSTMFDRHEHFGDQHDTEMLVRIGPIAPR